MKRTVSEKIYIIFNLVANKQYVGKTRNLDSRYSYHVSKLRSGKHDIPDLQRDWDRDGEDNFIWVDVLLRAGQMRPSILEDLLIDTLQTTDPTAGYNRMTSRGWSRHSRLRDLERKLIRGRKFHLLSGVDLNDPINGEYLEAAWKGHGRVKLEQGEQTACEDEWEALDEQGPMSEPRQDSDEGADEEDQPPEE